MTSTETKEMDIDDEKESTATTKVVAARQVESVTIHPLVLLSAVDHYHRVARGTRKRVVGVLLGQFNRGNVEATNSFAVPFEEDSRNPKVFYLDHNYLENMLVMFRKVNAKERVVGFYSTGPQIRPNDLRIHDIVQRFTATGGRASAPPPPAVFCIIDVRPDRPDLPVTSYKVTEEVSSSQKQQNVQRTFQHVPSQLGALEAEEVGVEHLLRDIHDPTVSTVAALVKGKWTGLATLAEKLEECRDYLRKCASGDIHPNPEIIGNVQTIMSLLPNLTGADQLVRSCLVKTNDMLAAIYLGSLIRSVLALHDLVNNKIRYGHDGMAAPEEVEEEKKEKEASDSKDKENKDKKEAESKESAKK